MILTFNKIRSQRFHLVIVGAGPAGIILSLEYAKLKPAHRVLLVDYGNGIAPAEAVPNSLDDSIQVPDWCNHHLPLECTVKGLGGSTATWGGRCVMYDRGDFCPRKVIRDGCTWDSHFLDACLPHVPVAQCYFESGQGSFDLAVDGHTEPLAEGFRSTLVSDTALERWSAPTRFGERYGAALRESASISVVLGAEARSLAMADDDGKIAWIEFRDGASRQTIKVEAEQIVLAPGAQETTRLLLRNSCVFSRLPKVPPALGLYYQGHISGKIASIRFTGKPEKTQYGFLRESDGTYQRRRFQFREQALVEKSLLNTAFWLDNPLYFDPAHRSGAMSFMYLAMVTPWLGKKLAPPTIAHSITKGKVHAVGAHLKNIFLGIPSSLWTPASIFVRRYLRKRKLPGVFLYSKSNCYALHFHAEQIPDTQNRMELGADGETLIIHYRVTQADAEGVVRAHEVFDQELQACGAGRLDYWFPPAERVEAIQAMSKDGVHQSGTTRIGSNSEEGVVDTNLRVHGTQNLYVCSSSVFPTSGQANPTFFLGVCAVRLAHHLSHASS